VGKGHTSSRRGDGDESKRYERYERVGEPVDGDFDYYSRSNGDCLLSRWELVILGLGL
jgi:hypothetical protein